jgi:hypothetical protein
MRDKTNFAHESLNELIFSRKIASTSWKTVFSNSLRMAESSFSGFLLIVVSQVDLLAKDGSQQQQESPSTSYNKAKMLLTSRPIARPGNENKETMARVCMARTPYFA